MPANELFRPLDYLDATGDIVTMSKELTDKCADSSKIYDLISELEAKAGIPANDLLNDKSPFYRLFLAYAYCSASNLILAKQEAERGVDHFNRNKQEQNEAVGRWFLGLLLCLCEDADKAEAQISEAKTIILKLNNELRRKGEYEIPDKKYQYPDILKAIDENFSSFKNRLLNDLSRIKKGPILPQAYFSEIMICLTSPADLHYMGNRQLGALAQAAQSLNDQSFITELERMLNQEHDEDEERFLIRFFLAHQSNLEDYLRGQQGSRATAFLEEAVEFYQSHDVNYFLARSYLSLLYYNRDMEDNGQHHLESACRCLNKVQQEYGRRGRSDMTEKLQYLQRMIRSWFLVPEEHHIKPHIQKSPKPSEKPEMGDKPKNPIQTLVDLSRNIRLPQKTSPKPPASEETFPASTKTVYESISASVPMLKSNKLKLSELEDTPAPHSNEVSSIDRNDSSDVRLLVVPVDLRALAKAEINDAMVTPDDIDKLARYDEEYVKQKAHMQPARPASNAWHAKRIPRFPIYGGATAGLNGEVLLPDPEGLPYGDEIFNDLIARFDGFEYKVQFINSPPPTIKRDKKYGWLKVTGRSMDNAVPKILERDYVLFCENHSLEACAGKIVVASLPEGDGQPPRLMIKRLVKLSGEIPCDEDGFGSELCKYVFHSESSLENDPVTGANLKRDIEIENENQLIGEIIAVAKSLKK